MSSFAGGYNCEGRVGTWKKPILALPVPILVISHSCGQGFSPYSAGTGTDQVNRCHACINRPTPPATSDAVYSSWDMTRRKYSFRSTRRIGTSISDGSPQGTSVPATMTQVRIELHMDGHCPRTYKEASKGTRLLAFHVYHHSRTMNLKEGIR